MITFTYFLELDKIVVIRKQKHDDRILLYFSSSFLILYLGFFSGGH